jgi:surfactin synthase thioesterase subunit
LKIPSKDNANINFDFNGTGPLLILLHGSGNDCSMWSKAGWIDFLKEHFTTVAFDLRGCGKSDKFNNSGDYSIENHFDDIDAIKEHFDATKPILWGWSLGATIALLYAKYRMVTGVVACGTYFGRIFSDDFVRSKIASLNDQIKINRLLAFNQWPTVYPSELKSPFLIYTGTQDGNVVNQLKKQENEIVKSNGKLQIFDNLDHMDLVNEVEIVKPFIMSFLNKLISSETA